MQELCFRVLTEPCDGMHSAPLCCQLARVLQLKRHVRLVFGWTEAALRPCGPAPSPMKAFYFCSWQHSGVMANKDVCCLYIFFLRPSESRLCARLCLYQIVLLLFLPSQTEKKGQGFISSISFQTYFRVSALKQKLM